MSTLRRYICAATLSSDVDRCCHQGAKGLPGHGYGRGGERRRQVVHQGRQELTEDPLHLRRDPRLCTARRRPRAPTRRCREGQPRCEQPVVRAGQAHREQTARRQHGGHHRSPQGRRLRRQGPHGLLLQREHRRCAARRDRPRVRIGQRHAVVGLAVDRISVRARPLQLRETTIVAGFWAAFSSNGSSDNPAGRG